MSFFEEVSVLARKLFSNDPFQREREEAYEYAAKHPDIVPARIDTAEQLHARYVSNLTTAASCTYSTMRVDHRWMKLLFNTFCVKERGIKRRFTSSVRSSDHSVNCSR